MLPLIMTMNEVFCNTFKAMRHELGQDGVRDLRPLWERRLSVAKLKPLAGRKVILFPDTDETGDTYRDWYEVAEAATDVFGHPVTVSSLLEQQATKAQKAAKIDIVDLIFE